MKSRSALWASLVLAALAAGVLWSNQIRSLFVAGKSAPEDKPDQLWTCGMHPQVIQDHPGDCPICHMKLTPLKVDTTSDGGSMPTGGYMDMGASTQPVSASISGSDRKVKYWWDPMLSPPYISDKPGKSPMGMDLIPAYEDESSGSAAGGSVVVIDPAVVQNMGVKVQMVSEGTLRRTIRAVGYLDEAQPTIRDINLRVSGWIKHLHANIEGMHVEQGDPLFDLYSPELRVAIEELINARRSLHALESASDEMPHTTAQTLFDAAVQKLRLWDLPQAQIDTLAKLDRAPETVTFISPITGYVTDKPVVEGASIMAGNRVLRIVDHTTLWMDAQIFEKDLPFIKLGQTVTATIASRPGESIQGQVIFIHPRVDMMSRTALVRLLLPNPDLSLRPGMYATVRIDAEMPEHAVMVPREAIIDSGERQMAFVAKAVGHFQPRKVVMGQAGDDGMVQVLDGLAPGEIVVVSGQFLLDSESRLREAIQKFLNEKRPMTTRSAAGMDDSMSAEPAHAASRQSTTTPPAHSFTSQVDAVVAAYLKMSDVLGLPQTSALPIDGEPLVMAAHQLHAALSGSSHESLAVNLANAGEAIKSQPLDRQRELFKPLSEAVIALVDQLPPSRQVGERLYVMYCPMQSAHWMQMIDRVNNPFYGNSMKQCGNTIRTIATVHPGEDQR